MNYCQLGFEWLDGLVGDRELDAVESNDESDVKVDDELGFVFGDEFDKVDGWVDNWFDDLLGNWFDEMPDQMVDKQANFVVYCCYGCTEQLADVIDLAGLVDTVLEVGCKFDCDCDVHWCFDFDSHSD